MGAPTCGTGAAGRYSTAGAAPMGGEVLMALMLLPRTRPEVSARGRSRSRALRRSRGTSSIASSAIREDILLAPRVRSANTIGTSRTVKPARIAR